ncbi:MAG: hypothetical protein KJO67_14405 [Silicimonas sp.]|nr:hypothetical protein [Silicimonas sp.]
MTSPTLTINDIDDRIVFHDDDEIMEASFKDLTLANSLDVNLFYDRIEERIAATGHDLWFFLVNYCNARIEPEAWFAFSRRGKELNLAHSMGSVRFDASEMTLRQIENAGSRENFDPNLFYDREGALERLHSLPSQRVAEAAQEKILSFSRADLNWRVEFLSAEETMFVDFSDMSFEHSADVDFVYDFIEEQIKPLGRKWYFLVNYNGTRIQSPAWVQKSARSKKLNEAWSLGSVRYAMGSETETDIRLRAESGGIRPNIRNSVEEAWERIGEMKAETAVA